MDIGRKLTKKDEPWGWAFGLEENEGVQRARNYENAGFWILGEEYDEIKIVLPEKEVVSPEEILKYFSENKPQVWNEKHIQYKKAYDYFLLYEEHYLD